MYIQVDIDNTILCITSEETVNTDVFKSVETIPEMIYEEGKTKRYKYNPENNSVYIEVTELHDLIIEVKPTIYEQILAENQYQTALLEMQMLGGI